MTADKSVAHGVIKKRDQLVIVAINIEKDNRLVMNPKLQPGNHLHELFEGAESTGKGNKSIRKFSHQGFALVHGIGDMQGRKLLMGHLHIIQMLWDNAMHLPPRSSVALAISSISPTEPPPYTSPILLAAKACPKFLASSRNFGLFPVLDPQYTQTRFVSLIP